MNLGIVSERAPLTNAAALKAALEDAAALLRMAKVWRLVATPRGLVGKRIKR